MRHLIIFCLAFCACARPAAPTVISNEVDGPRSQPSRTKNLEATITAYYFWRNPADGETSWDTGYAVVIDDGYVLAETSIDMRTDPNWEQAYLESVTIGPYDERNETGVGPWEAEIIERSKGFMLIRALTRIPVAAVVPAEKMPEAGDTVYYVADSLKGPWLDTFEGVVSNPETKNASAPYARHPVDLLVSYQDKPHDARAGVFNLDHEFIGFSIENWMPIQQNNPNAFPRFNGFSIVTIRGALRSLLQAACTHSYE